MFSGQATALSAFLQMNDLSSDEEDDAALLKQEERDHYDDAFEKMREQKMRSRQVKLFQMSIVFWSDSTLTEVIIYYNAVRT